jgi:hypothetical protein
MKQSAPSTNTGSPLEVDSVSSFLALIEKEKAAEGHKGNRADFIFRGQPTDNPLIPRIRRLHPKFPDLANSKG